MGIIYDPDNDPSAGGSHFTPTGGGPSATTYDPSQDPGVGSSQPPQPGILDRSWQSIAGGIQNVWKTAGGAIHAFDNPENREAAGAGLKRGALDVIDKMTEGSFADQGVIPSQADLDQIKQQQAAERARVEQQYGNNPSFGAGRIVGNTAVAGPMTLPLGLGVGAGLRAVLPEATGLLGVGTRAVERAVQGGVGGGAQAAATSDPSQPFGSQVASGAETGAFLGPLFGLPGDAISNAWRRLSGATVRPNPYTGDVPDITQQKAAHAQTLMNEGVPVQASQVSNDPYLQFANKWGGQIPGSGTGDFLDNQAQTWRNAALQRAEPGATGSLVDEPFINRNDGDIGNLYWGSTNAIPSVPSIGPSGNTIAMDFAPIRNRIPSTLDTADQARIHNAMNTIQDTFQDTGGPSPRGEITGSEAHDLTRRTNSVISPLLDSDDPTVRNFGSQIRDQVTQRLRSQMTPAQATMFDQANSRFRSLRTLENVADSDGSFDPRSLYTETGDAGQRFGGPGALDNIAQAGDSVIQPSLDGRSAGGPRIAGTAAPFGAGLIAGTLSKAVTDLLTSGGVGVAGTVGGAALNRGIQALNRSGGQRAIGAALGGGGASVADLQRALMLLRLPAVANQQQVQQRQANQPTNQ